MGQVCAIRAAWNRCVEAGEVTEDMGQVCVIRAAWNRCVEAREVTKDMGQGMCYPGRVSKSRRFEYEAEVPPTNRLCSVSSYDVHLIAPATALFKLQPFYLKQVKWFPFWLLRAFAKLQNETVSFVLSVCPSVRPRGTTRLPMKFFINFVFEHFLEICRENPSLAKIWQE
jgi:hypothetical protein